MGFKKGHEKIKGSGRKPGQICQSKANAREAIANFIDQNSNKLNGWLDEIYADKGAVAAFDSFHKLLEFHVPKLARTEQAGGIEITHKTFSMDIDGNGNTALQTPVDISSTESGDIQR